MDDQLPIVYSERTGNGPDYNVADFVHKGVHLAIFPHRNFLTDAIDGCEVHFVGDVDGKPNFSQRLNDSIIDGTPDDLEEIAETFATRLINGTKPEDMFQDSEEANTREWGRRTNT